MNRAGLDIIQADSLDQVKGQCLYPLVSEENREAFKKLVHDVFQGKPRTLEFSMAGLMGQRHILYTKAVPLHNDKGEIVSALSVTVDVTERKLAEREKEKLVSELQGALAKVKTLSGFLPICASCKKIRDDKGYWSQVESYISNHTDTVFSHGICPECAEKVLKDIVEFKKTHGQV